MPDILSLTTDLHVACCTTQEREWVWLAGIEPLMGMYLEAPTLQLAIKVEDGLVAAELANKVVFARVTR